MKGQIRLVRGVVTGYGILMILILLGLFLPISPIVTINCDLSNFNNPSCKYTSKQNIPLIPFLLYQDKVIIGTQQSNLIYSLKVDDIDRNQNILNVHNMNSNNFMILTRGNKQINISISEYQGKEYKKFWVIIPNKLVDKLSWKSGEELEAEVKGDKLIIKKD